MLLKATSKLEDFIVTKENVFSEELCDEIIQEYKYEDWREAQVFNSRENYRTNKELMISSYKLMSTKKRRSELDQIIFNTISPVISEYTKNFNGHLMYQNDSGYLLLKYQSGEYYKEHTDDAAQVVFGTNGLPTDASFRKRKITFIIQLNDNFEGGGISFFGDTHRVAIKKGSAILFPSNYLFPHQALPVTEGIRYSLITWLD
jgi:predicted 2-oxoglutarate/Fe(II)-dependent dioxygenase YbiX